MIQIYEPNDAFPFDVPQLNVNPVVSKKLIVEIVTVDPAKLIVRVVVLDEDNVVQVTLNPPVLSPPAFI